PSNISYDAGTRTLTLTPNALLEFASTYTVTVKSGVNGVKDAAGNSIAADLVFSFTTDHEQLTPPDQGPGGPILVLHDPANPFSMYSAEILRAEGLNEFAIMNIATATATPALLNSYDVIILGQMNINASQATMLSDWTTAGGTLIAFRPSATLSTLLGITPAAGTLSDKYMLVNTASGPGVGIVNQTIQFHSTADLYTLNGATSLATLYSDANTATANPAVTMNNVGSNGGRAIAFTYDLARSVVYTRQGNPAWAGQNRDGSGPIRSNDLFHGNMAGDPQPDWIDFNKISIPQADEHQRLLVNIIIQSNLDKKPLPRFWFLPSGHKAAVVMTGDDHQTPANSGTAAQFEYFKSMGPNTVQDILDWKAIRGTSYIYPGTMTALNVTNYQAQGFEISLHANTSCADVTPFSYENFLSTQLSNLSG
ncbi:MAG TPA: Ig-like domain-containing protein, partial [Chitinophagaceae bacterium]|nr:Ig-like domain-containing protein [Chitinophagaceae bacterium]